MAMASGMNTGSEEKLPLSPVRVSVAATRRIVKTPIASGARARFVAVSRASRDISSVASPEALSRSTMTPLCRSGWEQSRGSTSPVLISSCESHWMDAGATQCNGRTTPETLRFLPGPPDLLNTPAAAHITAGHGVANVEGPPQQADRAVGGDRRIAIRPSRGPGAQGGAHAAYRADRSPG